MVQRRFCGESGSRKIFQSKPGEHYWASGGGKKQVSEKKKKGLQNPPILVSVPEYGGGENSFKKGKKKNTKGSTVRQRGREL